MPITKRHFELGIDSEIEEWMRKIHTFLSAHQDSAFSEEELKKEFGISKPLMARTRRKDDQIKGAKFDYALNELVMLGAVEKRKVQGKDYYSYGPQPLEV